MAKRSCKKCFHYKACKEVASHSGYGDICYAESQCKNFISVDDVVKVIRCKDCANRVEFDTNKFHCELTGYYCGEKGYCSDGTPKEEVNENDRVRKID